jgi:hypothetical protein
VCDDYSTPFVWTGSMSSVTLTTPGATTVDAAQLERESRQAD